MEKGKQSHASKVATMIKNHNVMINQMISKEEKTDSDLASIEKMKVEISEIISQTEVVKNLPPSIKAILLDSKSKMMDNNIVAFSYTPVKKDTLNTGIKYNTVDKDLIIVKHDTVINGKAIGNSRTTAGIVDDLGNYGDPTLSISKVNYNETALLHDVDIKDEYKVAFDFTLNRFPSKVHQDTKHYNYSVKPANIAKKYTTRRSDLISFNYGPEDNENKIQFGVMAPMGLNANGSNEYDNTYDNFSIAACINHETNKKISVFTDYKFKLGETYHIILKIKMITDQYMQGLVSAAKAYGEALANSEFAPVSFMHEGISYNLESAKKQMEIWRKKLFMSDQSYDAKLVAFKDIRAHYEKSIGEGNPAFVYNQIEYTIEKAEKALQKLKQYLDTRNYFGHRAPYEISMIVNGERENVSYTNTKVWGSKAKLYKQLGILPIKPEFSTQELLNIVNETSDNVENNCSVYVNKFPKFVDDIIYTRLKWEKNQPRRKKSTADDTAPMPVEKLARTETITPKISMPDIIDDYTAYILQRLNNKEAKILADIMATITSGKKTPKDPKKVETDFMKTYFYFLRDAKKRAKAFNMPFETPASGEISIYEAYSKMKMLSSLGAESKIYIEDKGLSAYDIDTHRFDIRLTHMLPGYDNLIVDHCSRFTRLSVENEESIYARKPTTLLSKLDFNNARAFVDQMLTIMSEEGENFMEIKMIPRLKVVEQRKKNNLAPKKISVPVYTNLNHYLPVNPHYIIIDKVYTAKEAKRLNSTAIVGEPFHSCLTVLNSIDLTKLYSIYSTPYIIKNNNN
jgi:hypothetical protein